MANKTNSIERRIDSLKGFIVKAVIPSNASIVILFIEYWLFPVYLSFAVYGIYFVLKPHHEIIPLKKKLFSRNLHRAFITLLSNNLKSLHPSAKFISEIKLIVL